MFKVCSRFLIVAMACTLALSSAALGQPAKGTKKAAGPLRVHPDNPRYFTDGTKLPDGSLRAVYLTGAHTWNNLVDMGRNDPPEPFAWNTYLDFLLKHRHNFVRLWAWDSTVWDTQANGALGKDFGHHVAPLPWQRTGPGKALDGKPKFDLTKFDPAYFDRLQKRVQSAGDHGIYVSVMLFEGWGLMHGNRRRGTQEAWAWRNHPFNSANNINDVTINGANDVHGDVHRLGNETANRLQAAYIGKVVDTVNEFDNVLYEVINEGGEKEWDWWVVETVKAYERDKPKQHPVGITGHGAERLESMLASPADWISPGRADGFAEDPPEWKAEYKKVSVLDTDHIWGVGGNVAWVWKAFMRGHNPIFMDPYDGSVLGKPGDERWEPIRRALGGTRWFAMPGAVRGLPERRNLAALSPAGELASTTYCLANPGREYLVYLPDGGNVELDLSAAEGELRGIWYDAQKCLCRASATAQGGALRELKAPFDGPAVLSLRAKELIAP